MPPRMEGFAQVVNDMAGRVGAAIDPRDETIAEAVRDIVRDLERQRRGRALLRELGERGLAQILAELVRRFGAATCGD